MPRTTISCPSFSLMVLLMRYLSFSLDFPSARSAASASACTRRITRSAMLYCDSGIPFVCEVPPSFVLFGSVEANFFFVFLIFFFVFRCSWQLFPSSASLFVSLFSLLLLLLPGGRGGLVCNRSIELVSCIGVWALLVLTAVLSTSTKSSKAVPSLMFFTA